MLSDKARSVLLAIAGGMAGGFLFQALRLPPIAADSAPKLVSAQELRLVDGSGRLLGQLARGNEGSPALFLYDGKGTARVVIGLYGDGTPHLVLNDDKGLATAIVRQAGAQQSPVIVLKAKGRDRLILGLNMSQPQTDPFLVTFDRNGKKNHFGEY